MKILEFKVNTSKIPDLKMIDKPNPINQSLKEIYMSVYETEDGLDKFMNELNIKNKQ